MVLQAENIRGIANRTGAAYPRRLRGIIRAAERELAAYYAQNA